MAFDDEKRHALSLLRGIVSGELEPDQANAELEQADPTLVYFLLKYIKKHYHRDHDLYESATARLSELTAAHRHLTRRAKEGETDPVVEWFEGEHAYRDVDDETFVDLIIEKLEG